MPAAISFIALALSLLAFSSCSSSDSSPSAATSPGAGLPHTVASSSATRAAPRANPDVVDNGGPSTYPGASDNASTGAVSNRGRLLRELPPERDPNAKPGVDPLVSQYGKYRLEKASVIKSWASVPIVPIGVDAFLKTGWAKGNMYMRLALLGPPGNLQLFVRDRNQVKVTFTDRAGITLKEYVIPISELRQAAAGTNFGTPTYEFETEVPLPLEAYEEFYQWTFEWN